MYKLNFNFQEFASKYFLRFRMRFNSLPNDIKNHNKKFQIISNYNKLTVLCATNFLLKKGTKSDLSIDEVVNSRGSKHSYRNLELGEH